MLFKAIVSGIDKDRRLILEDIIQSDSNLFRDHCWTKPLSDKELGKARKILNKYGGGNSEPIYFYADVYWYGRKKALKNITKLTHEQEIIMQPKHIKVNKRTNNIYIRMEYIKVTTATIESVQNMALDNDEVEIGSDHITIKRDVGTHEQAGIIKPYLANLVIEGFAWDDIITAEPPKEEQILVSKVDVNIHIKLPKCTRAFTQYPDVKSIATDSGIITRDVFTILNNTEQTAVKLQDPLRYVVDGLTVPGAFVKEVEHVMQATFDCVYETDEFLRIEDSCIVISRNGETILLSNELMSLHDQTTEVIQHDGMYFLPEDTEFSQPISTQLMKLKKVTNKL